MVDKGKERDKMSSNSTFVGARPSSASAPRKEVQVSAEIIADFQEMDF